jgi:hypothetical protein
MKLRLRKLNPDEVPSGHTVLMCAVQLDLERDPRRRTILQQPCVLEFAEQIGDLWQAVQFV